MVQLAIHPALTLVYPRRYTLAAVPLRAPEIFCFFDLELLYEKLRYSPFKFSAVSSLFVCSASGSPTAAKSSLPTRA